MLVLIQHLLLLFDLSINSFVFLLLPNKIILLIFAVLQDIGILLSLSLYFVTFINTSYFKAGIVFPLIKKFWLTLLLTLLYFAFSICFHALFFSHAWNRPDGYVDSWTPLLQIFYVIHRILSVVFYYSYKRTSLRLCTPYFYNPDTLFDGKLVKQT